MRDLLYPAFRKQNVKNICSITIIIQEHAFACQYIFEHLFDIFLEFYYNDYNLEG